MTEEPTPSTLSPLSNYVYAEDLSYIDGLNKKNKPKKISINIKCVYPDPQNPGELKQQTGSISTETNKKVTQLCNEFRETYKDIPNKTYYLGYDQLLFRDGTIEQCGITHGKTVELIAPNKNAAVYHNEGLSLLIWSLLPMVFGLAAIIFSMTTDSFVDSSYQALFLFIGLIFLIPSVLCGIVGLILIPECPMPCYFSGTEWC